MNGETKIRTEPMEKNFTEKITALVDKLGISDLFSERDKRDYITFHLQLISVDILMDDKTLKSIKAEIKSFVNKKRVGQITKTCSQELHNRKTLKIASYSSIISVIALIVTTIALIVNIVLELK